MIDLTELTTSPEIASVESNSKVAGRETINRWTDYGNDRLYIDNWSRADIWLNLQTGEVEHDNAGGANYTAEIDKDACMVTIRSTGHIERELVIDLAPDADPETADEPSDKQDAETTAVEASEETTDDDADAEASFADAVMDDSIGKEAMTDGGRRVPSIIFGYDDGDRVYTRVEDDESREYGFVPRSLFSDSAPLNFDDETTLDDLLDAPDRETVHEAFDSLDVAALVADLVSETEWTEREAQMVVYRGWFGLSADETSGEIGIESKTVSNQTTAAANRQMRARTTSETPSLLTDRRTDSTLILDADVREELAMRKQSPRESTESVIGRLLDQTIAMDNQQYDTFTDVLALVREWIREGEPPFDPAEMDKESRDSWLDDLASLERIENQYPGREFSESETANEE